MTSVSVIRSLRNKSVIIWLKGTLHNVCYVISLTRKCSINGSGCVIWPCSLFIIVGGPYTRWVNKNCTTTLLGSRKFKPSLSKTWHIFRKKLIENSYNTNVVNLFIWVNTTNTFKARLDKFWHNQDVVYDWENSCWEPEVVVKCCVRNFSKLVYRKVISTCGHRGFGLHS